MKIYVTSVFVGDQAKALQFYTEKLGFVKKTDIPVGEFRWLTVVAPEGHEDVELLLEPNNNPAAKDFQDALFSQGIPLKSFAVENIESEYERLKSLNVSFTMPPTEMGPVTMAVLNDTCGNLIQIVEMR